MEKTTQSSKLVQKKHLKNSTPFHDLKEFTQGIERNCRDMDGPSAYYLRRQWQPTPVFLPGESQGWGSLMGCRLCGCTELDTTERLN